MRELVRIAADRRSPAQREALTEVDRYRNSEEARAFAALLNAALTAASWER
jgi:hypothetical protein